MCSSKFLKHNKLAFITLLSFRPAPKNEEEIMMAIFEAIDRLFAIVRPRRLLYMAIDGVVSNFFVDSNIVDVLTKNRPQ